MKDCLLGGVLLLSFACSAATGRYWTKVDGTWDGNWSEAARWNGNIPKSGEVAYFNEGITATVNVDTNALVGYWYIRPRDADKAVTTVTLVGDGSVACNGQTAAGVGYARTLIVDGPTLGAYRDIEVGNRGTLILKSGHLIANSNGKTGNGLVLKDGSTMELLGGVYDSVSANSLQGNASLLVDGATANMGTLAATNEASITVKSGSLKTTGALTLRPNSTLDVLGGDVVLGSLALTSNAVATVDGGSLQANGGSGFTSNRLCFASGRFVWNIAVNFGLNYEYLLPKKGSVLDIRKSSNSEMLYYTAAHTTRFDGTLYATNVAYGIYYYKCTCGLAGEGSATIPYMRTRGGYTATVRIRELNLKKGLGGNSTNSSFTFPEGIRFGSWGDWTNYDTDTSGGTAIPAVKLAKDVVFDTLDCLDGETTRTVTLTRCQDAGLASLTVKGGGTVNLAFTTSLSNLSRLEVAAGTTLDLTGSTGRFRTHRLVMGAGAVLRVPANGVDVLERCELDPTARIVIDVPEEVPETVAERRLVWCGTPMPSANVTFTGAPETWTMKEVAGVVYLSDGTFGAGTQAAREWVGTNSSSWAESANWTGGTVAAGGSNFAYFDRDLNPFVTNDYSATGVTLRGFNFQSTVTGPYLLSGAPFTLNYGGTVKSKSPFLSASKYPVIIDAWVRMASADGGYIRNGGNSYVAVIGGGEAVGTINVMGDVRFGGEWTGAGLWLYSQNDDGAASSRITVLPDAKMTLTGESGYFVAPTALTVCGVLDATNRLTATADARWVGSGAVYLNAISNAASASAALTLGESLTVYPRAGWRTVMAGVDDTALTLKAENGPTLGATCDWTYGPEADAEPTTDAADRALAVSETAVLTIDTEDPVTGVGHAVTFADPIVAAGKVVKTGVGSLVLASAENDIAELSIEEGTVTFPVAQTLGKVTFAAGTKLALAGDLEAAAGAGWTTILTAKSVTGLDAALAGGYRLRTQTADDGSVVVQAKGIPGILILLK